MIASSPDPSLRALAWIGDARSGILRLIDQTQLPGSVAYLDCRDVPTVFEAIRSLRVRGAPAIGLAAAYGVVLAVQGIDSLAEIKAKVEEGADTLARSRPTAVNLFWALDRMKRVLPRLRDDGDPDLARTTLLAEAQSLFDADLAMCRAIGAAGADLIDGMLPDAKAALTHCNAGWLVASAEGTALAPIYALQERGRALRVYADETRPLLQGARLTAWELSNRGVPVTLICDNMAAQVMRSGRVDFVIVGADRIAANGDTANKIGTYGVAALARMHGIPFFVAAPSSTFDFSLESGDLIPIEERAPAEITEIAGRAIAPAGIEVYNPAFDVTPASLITALITERGAIRPVERESIRRTLRGE